MGDGVRRMRLFSSFSQMAVLITIKKINYQPYRQPDKKAIPVCMALLGHEVKTT
jgi:hypothetical protein